LNLARIHPIEFTKFTIENAPVIQKKMKSFNQVVDSVFFQLDERRGCKELSDLFVELLDKMGLENLKTFYKNEAFQNAILGNKNYETLVSKMKEVWGMSTIDFIPMDRIDASCLTYLDTQPDFRKRFEEECSRNFVFAHSNEGSIEITPIQLLHLPESSRSIFVRLSYGNDVCISFTSSILFL
jgi:uncharacterized protein YigA (DUF484 family)